MGAVIPTHWRGEKTDFATLEAASMAVQELATHDARPRIDSAIEIARRRYAANYIDEISLSMQRVVRAVDQVMPVLKVDTSKAFQVVGHNRVPLRGLARKALLERSGRANATVCARKSSKTWAGASTGAGRRIGSIVAAKPSKG